MTKRQKPIQWLIMAALCLFFSVAGFYIGMQLGWWLSDEGYTITWRPWSGDLTIALIACSIPIALR